MVGELVEPRREGAELGKRMVWGCVMVGNPDKIPTLLRDPRENGARSSFEQGLLEKFECGVRVIDG